MISMKPAQLKKAVALPGGQLFDNAELFQVDERQQCLVELAAKLIRPVDGRAWRQWPGHKSPGDFATYCCRYSLPTSQ